MIGDKSSGAEGAARNSENLQKKVLGTTSTYSVIQQKAVGLSTGSVRASTLALTVHHSEETLKKNPETLHPATSAGDVFSRQLLLLTGL